MQLTLKTPWHDGTTHILLTPSELLQRLVALVPRPAKNLLVYYGVLAGNSKWRSRVRDHNRVAVAASNAPAALQHQGDCALESLSEIQTGLASCGDPSTSIARRARAE